MHITQKPLALGKTGMLVPRLGNSQRVAMRKSVMVSCQVGGLLALFFIWYRYIVLIFHFNEFMWLICSSV